MKQKKIAPVALLLACVLAFPFRGWASGLPVQIGANDLSRNDALPGDVRTILLLMYDSKDGSRYGVSETMLLASIHNKTGDASMAVLQSDLIVSIPQVGDAPLSRAYALGGENLAMKTINQAFGLNVKDCIAINMEKFAGLVNTVGNLSVELAESDAVALGLPAGQNALNEAQVLSYIKLPRSNPAVDRQYQVFRQALYQGSRDLNVAGLVSMLSQVLGSMDSNIGIFDLAGLGGSILGSNGQQREQRFPAVDQLTATEYDGAIAYIADLETTRNQLFSFIYE